MISEFIHPITPTPEFVKFLIEDSTYEYPSLLFVIFSFLLLNWFTIIWVITSVRNICLNKSNFPSYFSQGSQTDIAACCRGSADLWMIKDKLLTRVPIKFQLWQWWKECIEGQLREGRSSNKGLSNPYRCPLEKREVDAWMVRVQHNLDLLLPHPTQYFTLKLMSLSASTAFFKLYLDIDALLLRRRGAFRR